MVGVGVAVDVAAATSDGAGSALLPTAVAADLSVEMLVVFALIGVALVLFVTEPVPIDTTAIAMMVAVIVLEPWTGVGPMEGVSGFANPATVTVLAMFILSEGVRRTGAIQTLTRVVSNYTGDDETKQLVAIVGLAGPPAGFVNNTPIVAVLIPAVIDLARKAGTSPSKLLMPLSFAAMLGGTLTLIGTSSNLLASDVWTRQGGPTAEPFALFEFTQLGIVVLAVGVLYLLTVGRWLLPARIEPADDLGEQYRMSEYLTDVVVLEDASIVGETARELRRDDTLDLEVFQIVRDGRPITRRIRDVRIRPGDILAVRADEETLQQVIEEERLALLPEVIEDLEGETDVSERIRRSVTGEIGTEGTDSEASVADEDGAGGGDEAADTAAGEEPGRPPTERTMTEVVLLPGSWLAGRTYRIDDFQRAFDVTVLAVRRGSELRRTRMREVRLRGGDTLLVQADEDALGALRENRSIVVSGEEHWEAFDRRKLPVAVGIIAGVVALAALDVLPIMVSALGGIVAMIVTGCLRPAEAYDAVNWDVIFLLAGVIPLGIAMERTGAAAVLSDVFVSMGGTLPAIALLGVFYLFTAVLTELVTNNASVVLMIPVAIDAAMSIGANPFAFVLAVTFAASTAFMTPVGYQTNLMVYGPGGYRFTDYLRVGLPLQLLLTIVTPFGIAAFWGV